MEIYDDSEHKWISLDDDKLTKEQSLMIMSQEIGYAQWDGFDGEEKKAAEKLEELGWVYKPAREVPDV
jgi:hypothetical protein